MTTSQFSTFSKICSYILVPGIFVGSCLMAFYGYSLSSEKDPDLLKMYENCQPHERGADGRCPRALRSGTGRSFRGGSYGFGK